MKINAVNNYRFDSINFESRNKKDTPKPASSATSTMKAIPFAVLLAMSPLNAPAVNAQKTIPQVNKTLIEKKRHVHTYEFQNAVPGRAYNCKMNYIHNKKNDPESERIQLVMYRSQPIVAKYTDGTEAVTGYKNYSNTIDLNKIKKVNMEIYNNYGYIGLENKYFVEGPGIRSIITTDLKGKVVGTETKKCDNIKMEISEDLFNELKATMNKDVEYKEETQLYED